MADEMTPEERTARIAALLSDFLDEVPTARMVLFLGRDELKKREATAQAIGDEISSLARNE